MSITPIYDFKPTYTKDDYLKSKEKVAPSVEERLQPIVRRCVNCNITQTPEWRNGQNGKTVCNSCGIKYSKKMQKERIEAAKRLPPLWKGIERLQRKIPPSEESPEKIWHYMVFPTQKREKPFSEEEMTPQERPNKMDIQNLLN